VRLSRAAGLFPYYIDDLANLITSEVRMLEKCGSYRLNLWLHCRNEFRRAPLRRPEKVSPEFPIVRGDS
jgi:hypothetical protein